MKARLSESDRRFIAEIIDELERRMQNALYELRFDEALEEDYLDTIAKTPKQKEIDAADRTIAQAKLRKKQARLKDLLAKAQKLRSTAVGSPLLPPPLGNPFPQMRQRKK